MTDSLFAVWRDVVLSPRTGFPRRIRETPRLSALTFSAVLGILQSFMQGAASNLGLRAPLTMLVLAPVIIGSLWGLLQVHVVSGLIYLVARSGDDRIPFVRVRHMVSLAAAPAMLAFLGWLLAISFLGPMVFINPGATSSLGPAPAAFLDGNVQTALQASPAAYLAIGCLFLLTAVCAFWYLALLVLGVKTIEETSIGGALGTLGLAALILLGMAILLAVVFVVGLRLFRGH